jgi:hypothetical protein
MSCTRIGCYLNKSTNTLWSLFYGTDIHWKTLWSPRELERLSRSADLIDNFLSYLSNTPTTVAALGKHCCWHLMTKIPWRFFNTESLPVLDSNIIWWWTLSCWFILWHINYKEFHAFKGERLSRFVQQSRGAWYPDAITRHHCRQ